MTKQVKNELINCNGLSARIELINIKNGTLQIRLKNWPTLRHW